MAKKAAFNTRIQITDPADDSIIRVKYLGDISGPEVSVSVIDVMSHDSPDGFTESLAGLAEAGEVTFELFFDPTNNGHARLLEMVDEREETSFTIRLPADAEEFVSNPEFGELGIGWTNAGGWGNPGGPVEYNSSNPGADELLSTTLLASLLIAETYTLAVTFTGAVAGTGLINAYFGGVLLGTLNPALGGTQYIRWDATVATGELEIEVPEDLATTQTFQISRISVTGIVSNSAERFTFNGLITKAGVMAPVGDALKASIAVKVSGKPVYNRAD